MIYTVQITGLAAGSSTPTTLNYCTGEGYADVAGNVFLPRVSNPGLFERHAWAPGTTRGSSTVNYGVVELVNVDGALDFMATWDFDGRALVISRDGVAVFTGTMDFVLVGLRAVTVRMRDAQAVVAAKLAVTARYLGTNALPNGVEGVATDLKGRCKPLLIGEAENFQPPRVNTSLLVYQISSRAISAIVSVFDNGAVLTAGTNRTTLAALLATAPSAGTYDYCLGNDATPEGAYFRLGSTPGNDAVTCYARQGSSQSVAQCVLYALAQAGVLPAGVVGVAALDAITTAPVGYWCDTSDTAIGPVLDALCASVGASWSPTRAGKFQLLRLASPGAATVTFGTWQLLGPDAVQTIPTEDDGRGIPVYEVDLQYSRNYTLQSGAAVAGSVSTARADYLKLDYRHAVSANTATWDTVALTGRNPTAKSLPIVTQLRVESDAKAEAARLLTIYGQRRRYLSFVVPPSAAAAIDIGAVVSVNTTRLGLSSVPLLVVGITEDFLNNTTTIYGWG